MGCTGSEIAQINMSMQKEYLNIATLNYSSHNISPFQYFSLDYFIEEKDLDHKMSMLIKNNQTDLNEKINLKAAKAVDAILRPRYSPLYENDCGIRHYKFENKEQFYETWRKNFDGNQSYMLLYDNLEFLSDFIPANTISDIKKEKGKPKFNKINTACASILENLKKFDFLIYQGILMYVYETNSIELIFKNRGVAKYLGFMERFFSKNFLNQSVKLKKVINFLNEKSIDIMFLQNVTGQFCNNFIKKEEKYRIIRGMKPFVKDLERKQENFCNSAIIMKQGSFAKGFEGRKGNIKFLQVNQDISIPEEIKKEFLKWKGSQTSIISIGNFILISFSIGEINLEKEIDSFSTNFIEHVRILVKKYPNKYIVIGGIFSSSMATIHQKLRNNLKELKGQFFYYPPAIDFEDKDYMTCHNIRTFTMLFEEKERDLSESNRPNCQNFLIFPQHLYQKVERRVRQNKIERDVDIKGIYSIEDSDEEVEEPTIDIPIQTVKRQKASILETYRKSFNEKLNFYDTDIGFLPNDKHPFKEYVVAVTLKVPPRKKKNIEQQQRQEQQYQKQQGQEQELFQMDKEEQEVKVKYFQSSSSESDNSNSSHDERND